MKNTYKIIYILLCICLCNFYAVSQNTESHSILLEDKSIEIKQGKFYKNNKLISAKLIFYYESGRIKSEINLEKGMLNGLSVGFLDKNRKDFYKKKYVYNYENNKKVGDQFEYYDKSIQLPNFKKTTENGYLEYAHPIDLEPYFGNRDNFSPISWKPNKNCSRTFQKNNPDSAYLCPSGSLIVYYEKFDVEYNKLAKNKKRVQKNQSPITFFQSNYGQSHSFWHLFRTQDGNWHFD